MLKTDPEAGAPMFEEEPLWYKDAIIYQLHVKCFCDTNDDGYGDFRGLTERLDYIHDLGVTAIWLLPFYPSPLKDDGYDIADYRDVHPDYGTMRDFRAFVRKAHRLGLKVITELVINHTSDQHPWFQAARRAPPGSPRRDLYIWSDTDQKYPETRIIFTDTETSNWAWDPEAQAYFWHRFFSHQPDLNHNNPKVVRALMRVMRFWLDAGVDGLRLDAIPYLCVREGTNNENLPETHQVIKQMRAELDAHYAHRIFLAEANQWPEDVREYFGDQDECHMAFHFPVMPRIFMAVAQEDRQPIVEIMIQTPEIPPTCQWAIFLRNHDELTLEMVTDRERDYMYQHYATDPQMRRNVGICRRLAPLMDNDRNKIELLNSLLLSFPGTPIIYYGDELGMGDNIYLGDRNGVRTPMQWSVDRNAGFSRTDPARLYLPVIMNPIYGYQAINVEAQARNTSSLLSWMQQIIAVRKEHKGFGRGTIRFCEPRNQKILAYLREWEGETLLCVANLASSAQPVELDLREFEGLIPVELMGRTPFPRIGELPYLLTLPGYGFYWFRLMTDAETSSYEELQAPLRLPFWVLPQGWQTVIEDKERLAHELLPGWLPGQRWFGGKGAPIEQIEVTSQLMGSSDRAWLLVLARVQLAGWETQTYFVPLALSWGDEADQLMQESPFCVVAKIRQGPHPGVLHDAYLDPGFSQMLLAMIQDGKETPFADGRLVCSTSSAFPGLAEEVPENVHTMGVEQSHTSVVFEDRMILKGYRHLPPSPSPELELGLYLTEMARFPNTPPVAGAIQLRAPDGDDLTVAVLQGFIPNQGDGWSFTLQHLERYFEHQLTLSMEAEAGERRAVTPTAAPDPSEEGQAAYVALAHTLGLRTGQLHTALAAAGGDPTFVPEPVLPEHLVRWRENVCTDANRTLDMLQDRRPQLPEGLQPEIQRLLELREPLLQRIDGLVPKELDAVMTRFHGDYHLGQVLVVHHDIQIIDFEGEQPRPSGLRWIKHLPLRDVAGMLRSFNYAAYAALFRVSSARPDDLAVLEPYALHWEEQTASSFLSGYEEGIQGCRSYPDDPEVAGNLLELFVLEKALYEVNYEFNHRPDWIYIPIKGILTQLERSSCSTTQESL